ncbi:uncharacterized protein LOC123310409 [Coccinella septempunctata]|uniref:uncharacterized protein LOC123310409 n=1 Tax=Coccinella septempunctata TaxID=41139 RepID=UPI001D063905|nr:uncharacterized protein LOC123310409 [Coccinella septempunctata]
MASLCYKCGKVFSNISSLRRHARNFHRDEATEIAPNLYKNAAKYNYNCHCGKNFSDINNFTNHQKIHGGDSSSGSGTYQSKNKKCPLCNELFTFKNEILKHFEEFHELVIKSSTLKFNSQDEFFVWKNELEAKTNASFVKYNNKDSRNWKTSYLICNRSGTYLPRVEESERKRYLKIQGSYKINSYCPASIKFSMNKVNNTCQAEYIETHVGHDLDPGYVNLSKPNRQKIAQKIASKIPFEEILNEVRENVSDSEVSRIHLLRRKDLYNIEQSFNLSSSAVRHPNDGVSVDSWVKEMQEEKHCVLFYKPQGILDEKEFYLKKEDFVLIIMTTAQKEFLAKYGSDIICLDGTHGVNGYDFELSTLLVLDDLREGFPCSFLISNRSDKEVFKLMFSKIREEINVIAPKVFMSDMAESFYNAWTEVMGVPEKRLFCTWHVLRAWKKNLVKIKSKDKQNEVHNQLHSILHERDQQALRRKLFNFLNQCGDPGVTDFINYFKENYLLNIENWAYAYRLHAGINTNMHLERFHKTLKYMYLKGKKVKRLDKGICAIMQFVRDKLFDRLISRHKGKICSKVKEIRVRHETMTSLDKNLLIKCEDGWKIPSNTSEETYFIRKTDSDCQKCQLKCTLCNICIHEYICSCIDSSIKFNMCKHIHLVAASRKENLLGDGGPNFQTDTDITVVGEECEDTKEKNLILNEVGRKRDLKRSVEKEKEDIRNKIARHLRDIHSPTKLQVIKNILAPLSPTLAAVDSNNSLPSTSRIPHNMKIVPQRSLFSTRNKKSKKKYDFI